MPIRLSEPQHLAIDRTAAALPPSERARFLRIVHDQLAGQVIGDGAVHRAIAAAFGMVFDPPDIHTPHIRGPLPRASKLKAGAPIDRTRSDSL